MACFFKPSKEKRNIQILEIAAKMKKQDSKKGGVSIRSFSCWSECSRRGLNLFSPVEIFEKMPKIGLFDFLTSLTKPSFLSFYELKQSIQSRRLLEHCFLKITGGSMI